MDIEGTLEFHQSKNNTTAIALEIITNPGRMDELVGFILNDSNVLSQRASWPLSVVAETNNEILHPFLNELVDLLSNNKKHPAVKRNVLRAFQFIQAFPEELEGKIIDRCFQLLNSNEEPIAVRVFSMQVIYNLSTKYPEIQPELKECILFRFENESAGFQSRGKRILKRITK